MAKKIKPGYNPLVKDSRISSISFIRRSDLTSFSLSEIREMYGDLVDEFGIFKYDYLKKLYEKRIEKESIYHLGQLSFKKEAAGKLRVFAMVDVVTQSLFRPLHDLLFSILRGFPNDGTFDQSAAFARAVEKSKVTGHCFGYDLTAATDRLPIILQVSILKSIIGEKLASLWSVILVNRDYFIPSNPYDIPVGNLRYSVGQPMGALSS